MRRRRRALLVGCVTAAALVAATATATTAQAATGQAATPPAGTAQALALPAVGAPATPDRDDFYRAPLDRGRGDPGDVLRARRSHVYPTPALLVAAPVRAWQVIYRSTGARDEPTAVSGTVMVPEQPWHGPGPRPVVSYTIGTHGLGDQCAPSYKLASGSEQEFALMSQALQRGWAVAATDYQGLGTPGDHAYAVQVSEGRAALDMARAATRLPGAGLSHDAPVGLWGYSQGGGAAASAAEQAHGYAPDLHTVGVAEGGVPADLRAVARNLDGGVAFGLLAGAAAGYDTAYPGVGVRDLLNAKGRALVAQVRGECVEEMTARNPGHHLAEYSTVRDPLSYPPLVRVLADNRIGGTAPDMPVRLYHAQADELIPLALSRTLRDEYCRRGVRTQYEVIPAAEHLGGAVAGGPPSVSWLADRFAGRPAPSSCG
ncbi:MAG TPA: lipase family protein [Pseudonocardia sp.]|jgi:dienelactone hydrolase